LGLVGAREHTDQLGQPQCVVLPTTLGPGATTILTLLCLRPLPGRDASTISGPGSTRGVGLDGAMKLAADVTLPAPTSSAGPKPGELSDHRHALLPTSAWDLRRRDPLPKTTSSRRCRAAAGATLLCSSKHRWSRASITRVPHHAWRDSDSQRLLLMGRVGVGRLATWNFGALTTMAESEGCPRLI
jgi:hypothetical protein